MARRTLRILPYKGNRDYHYYLDRLKVNGKRKRLFFTSEAEAKEELLRNLATEIGFAHWPNNGLRHSFASYQNAVTLPAQSEACSGEKRNKMASARPRAGTTPLPGSALNYLRAPPQIRTRPFRASGSSDLRFRYTVGVNDSSWWKVEVPVEHGDVPRPRHLGLTS